VTESNRIAGAIMRFKDAVYYQVATHPAPVIISGRYTYLQA